MRRRLWNILAAVSLLLCVAAAALWVRSYWVYDNLAYYTHRVEVSIPSLQGAIGLSVGIAQDVLPRVKPIMPLNWVGSSLDRQHMNRMLVALASRPPPSGFGWLHDPTSQYKIGPLVRTCEHRLLGFGYGTNDDEYHFRPTRRHKIVVPHAFMVAICAMLPLLWLRGALRESRRKGEGFCRACGYDIRASSGRCPECGGVIDICASERR